MPNRDQTGPLGLGARTGRGQGFCGKGQSIATRPCKRFFLTQDNKESLEQTQKILEEELKAVRKAKDELKEKK